MSNTTYYGPNEPADTIFLERAFLAADFFNGVGYGAQIVLYASCAKFLWNVRHSRGRQSTFLLVYITLLFCVETIYAAVQARTVQVVYIDNRNYPGGPWAYFLATQSLAINVMFYATLFVLTFLADLLVLWRCWVIWSASGRRIAYAVVSIPGVLLLGSFGKYFHSASLIPWETLWTLESSQPGLSLYSARPLAFGTSYYAISLSVNIILTILITVRLLLYRRRVIATLPSDHGRHYFSLATIIIESATIYSICSLMFIVSYAINNPLNQIFFAITSSAQQIAGYLIIYRLAEGRAWNRTTLANESEGVQTTLRFDLTSHHSHASDIEASNKKDLNQLADGHQRKVY